MKIYVIRHGITELNKKKIVNGQIDEPLSQEGMEQAKSASPLIPLTITHIYTSPLQRTKQTAEVVNSKLNRSITTVNELTEIHMGTLAGHSWQEMENGLELRAKHRRIQFNYQPYGGESAEDVKKRLLDFLKKINNKHKDYEVLLITHGGIIRVLHLLENNQPLVEEIGHITPHIFNLGKILKKNSKPN